jgi:hypothetical protein
VVTGINAATIPASQPILASNSSRQIIAATTTGSGSTAVLATSPSLITPNLGVPSAHDLLHATDLQCGAMPALTGAVTSFSGSCATTLTATRHVCDIGVGDTSAAMPLTNAQLGPQSRVCFIPSAATVIEMDVNADAGTPNVIVAVNHAGSDSNIVSSALATAASGGIACSNTGGTVGLNGVTTCSGTLQNTSMAAGDYLELVSGTAGGTAKWFAVHVIYTY